MKDVIFILIVIALTVPVLAQDQPARGGRVKGILIDPSGVAAGGGLVRVLEPESNRFVTRANARADGEFHTETIQAGSYTLIAWLQGFRAHRSAVVVRDGETIDLGNIQLDLAGCDAPGVMCDDFGMGPPDPIVKNGYMELRSDCGGELRNGRTYCPVASGTLPQETAVDVGATTDGGGIYLTAVNGTALFADCRDGKRIESKIRIDGLGRGDDICIRTHDGLPSHIFFSEDVEPTSQRIRIWYVTRKRQ